MSIQDTWTMAKSLLGLDPMLWGGGCSRRKHPDPKPFPIFYNGVSVLSCKLELFNIVATSYMWLLSTCNVASVTEKLNF